GTPLISDPGQILVAAAHAAGIRVESVPGPSAVMAALSASGFAATEFIFLGFPPSRSKDRETWVTAVSKETRLAVFFEAPHRIVDTLRRLGAEIGSEKTVAVGRELTKLHEELVIRPISDLISYFSRPKGEFIVLVPPASLPPPDPVGVDAERLRREFGVITKNSHGSKRQAVKELASRHNLSVNEVYRLVREED